MADKYVVCKVIGKNEIGYETLANVQRDALRGEDRIYEPLSRAFATVREACIFQEGFKTCEDIERWKFVPPNLDVYASWE